MDPRTKYDAALDQTATIIAAVRPSQLSDPTPCSDYDVRALLGHMVGGVNRVAHVGEGGRALDVPAHADDVPADGLADAFDVAAKRARAAWADDAKLDAMFSLPWGEVPGRGAVTGYVVEILTHGWDLAKATGQETERSPELGRFALDAAAGFIPAEPRGGPIPFAPVREAPADAGVYTRLAAWLGREV